MDEATLIAAARLGDEDAFTELYRQHEGYVRAIGRTILRKSDVDDMCQDTFLLAFTRLHSFQGGCQFRTWITRIATNHCLVTLRTAHQAMNGETNLIQMDPDLTPDDGLGGSVFAVSDRHLEALPARLELHALFRALPPYPRRLLKMTYLEDLTAQEIAKALGISLSSVKRQVDRAKKLMVELHKNR